MNYTEKYRAYKQAFNIQKRINNFNNLGKLKFKCSVCKKYITINGATSHSKIHSSVMQDKINYLVSYFNGYEYSIVSGKKINYDIKSMRRKYITVVNSKEYHILITYINFY